ncbi:hypothetical protein PYCC9005_001046 [Savitreella phatthalungensis]
MVLLSTAEGNLRPRSPFDLTLHILFQPLSVLLLSGIVYFVAGSFYGMLMRFSFFQATYKFPYPLATLCLAFVLSEIVLMLWTLVGKVAHRKAPEWAGLFFSTKSELTLAEASQLVPAIVTFVAAEISSVVCLANFSLATYLRLTAPAVLLQILIEDVPDKLAMCTAIALFASSLLVTATSPRWTVIGTLSGLATAVLLPICHRETKRALHILDGDSVKVTRYLLYAGITVLVPATMLSGEFFDMIYNCYFFDEVALYATLLLISLTGGLYYISRAILLGHISPLTLTVLWLAKAAAVQSPSSERFSGVRATAIAVFGVVSTIAFTTAYLLIINRHRPKFGLWFRQH